MNNKKIVPYDYSTDEKKVVEKTIEKVGKKAHSYGGYGSIFYKSCHRPTEIHKNFYLCARHQVDDLLRSKKIDVLVPLDSLDGHIWSRVKPGEIEIFYFPIVDYSVLNQDHLTYLVNEILRRLKEGKKLALFCLGGHGRTGYVAACVLGKLGIKDPIGWIWTHYCKQCVESVSQARSIKTFLGNGFNVDYYIDFLVEEEKAKQKKYLENQKKYSWFNGFDAPGGGTTTVGGTATIGLTKNEKADKSAAEDKKKIKAKYPGLTNDEIDALYGMGYVESCTLPPECIFGELDEEEDMW